MTQDVQPLTWQKRTNIEEHQQFFSKINEIIGNLAPTVGEAEQAIAQATQAVTDANGAITTANAASAAADAAAQQAQTAANTVAGYNTRLIAVEDEAAGNTANITDLQDRMGTAEGKITALQGVQGDYVKKAGAAQTVTSQIMVPTTDTGLRDTQIANGTRIQNDLDAYAPMVRTTGSQTISGVKTFKNGVDGLDYHYSANTDNTKDNAWRDSLTFPYADNHIMIVRLFSGFNNDDTQDATIKIRMRANTVSCVVIETAGTIESMAKASNYVAVYDGENVTLKTKKIHQYTNLFIKVESWGSYGYAATMPNVTYPNANCNDPSTETFVSISVGAIVPYRNVN